ncbi:MAG: hypothetical protein GF317_21790 [Candidatus Lokiarchaeota archaeon]|nr:hypothetical protein [Candidatus Lokiarchaeota archaeon]MBD3202094.1 hypothetical protein [Candidatus Lokiarchaeota archaeon]
MINIKEKCDNSKKKEFYYGAKINKKIKDAYLGMGYLEPNENNRKIGPGRRHEEILFILNGKLKLRGKSEEIILNEGDVYFLSDGNKIKLENLSESRSYFIIAGGHTKHHKH